ncbi:hypothetical protein GGR50DRAFT_705391 [Xylaria sp. CBS 124048]|nr:hypothetical protein GGR50DRAFT_705391 [Xylaria sp. CBS 124048]
MAAQLTPGDIAWMTAHKNDTLVPNIYACSAAGASISVVILILRVWSRRLARKRIIIDISDWFILLACVCYIVALISFSLSARYGLGRHVIFVTDVRLFWIWSVNLEVFYYLTIGFIKLSILSFYGTIFTSRQFRPYLWVVAIIVIAWSVTSLTVSIAQCLPLEYGWDKTIPGGHCINYGQLVLSAGVVNVVTDFGILALPIPLVLKLQIPQGRKYLLVFTFALGSSACIVSIVRLAYSLIISSTADVSWNNVKPGFVSAAELLVGILAASIPTYRPLYRRYFQRLKNVSGNSGNDSNPPGKGQLPSQSRGANISARQGVTVNGPGVHVTDEIELTRHTFRDGAWVRLADEEATESRQV